MPSHLSVLIVLGQKRPSTTIRQEEIAGLAGIHGNSGGRTVMEEEPGAMELEF